MVWGPSHLGIFLWEKNLLFCLKCFLEIIYKGQAIFTLGFYSICLGHVFYNMFNQWFMVFDMFCDLSQNHAHFHMEHEVESPWVRLFIYLVLHANKIIRSSIYPCCSHGLKAMQRLLCDSIYTGISDEFWRAYKPKCHWNSMEASDNLNRLCPTSLSV